MLDQMTTVEVRFGKIYQDARQLPVKKAMPRSVAWAIVLAFAIALVAIVTTPFVSDGQRVVVGVAAGVALICFFGLVGAVKVARGED